MDRIVTRKPIDKTARLVTGDGIHYNPQIRESTTLESDLPLPTRISNHNLLIDLTGTKAGWLTVIGLYVKRSRSGKGKALWVCRCNCGKYVLRKAKSIKNKNKSKPDMCLECAKVERLKEWHNKKNGYLK